MPTLRSKVNARSAEIKASADRSRKLVEEDIKFKLLFSRPLPPRQGRWPGLLWPLESAWALESADSAAQTRPVMVISPG